MITLVAFVCTVCGAVLGGLFTWWFTKEEYKLRAAEDDLLARLAALVEWYEDRHGAVRELIKRIHRRLAEGDVEAAKELTSPLVEKIEERER